MRICFRASAFLDVPEHAADGNTRFDEGESSPSVQAAVSRYGQCQQIVHTVFVFRSPSQFLRTLPTVRVAIKFVASTERVGAITSPIRNCLISCALRDGGGALFSAFAGSSACPLHASGSDLQNERSHPAIDAPAKRGSKARGPGWPLAYRWSGLW